MKTLVVVYIILITTISFSEQKNIEGIWDTGIENTKIEIKSSSNLLEGKILASDNTKVNAGKLVVKDIVEKKNQIYTGKLYIIKYDKWVDAVFERMGNKLKITVSKGFRSKTLEWFLEK